MNYGKHKKDINSLGSIIIKFLLLIVCITLIINFILNNIFITKYFNNMQREQVASKTEQSMKVFQSKLMEIERVVRDYALWDEIYSKIQEEKIDNEWYEDNFTTWVPEKYGIDLVVIINRNKKIIAQHGLNNSDEILNDNNIMKSLNIDEFKEESRVIIVKPIKNLENQIKKMEHENLLMQVDLNGPNEIINLAESFNHMIDSINEHKKENQQLKMYANEDFLTSVYTHKYYFESIRNKIAEGHKQIAVMFCDLDKFKLANDTYGHETGDSLLKETAKIIKAEVKDKGMVFRYGGEEFVVIMWDYTSEDALTEAEKIRKSIAENLILQKYSGYFPITISIGIASYPKNALNAEGLIKKSDTAMYFSKRSGRNQCNIYNDNMKVFLNDGNKVTDNELLMDSVLALSEAVDTKDKYTGEHSKMVSKYSILLAEKLGFTESEKNKLRMGALLHDCGKIGIPDNIINKPEKLSDEEFDIIKSHTLLGYNIIKHLTNDEEIINCVRSHHERWDGTGYPDKLSGNYIKLFARIVCIADVYHAMTSDRSYRKALTKEKARDEFIKGKGTKFDPVLVEAFIEIIEKSIENNYTI